MKPKMVSVVVACYNHERYIKQCLESLVAQKVNFEFEILVNDDGSLDDSAKIIKAFVLNYPDKFRVIYQKENQYSKGVKPWFHILFPLVQTKYIALCEGDDYWLDPYKLQKQVDFLEANPSFVYIGSKAISNIGEINKLNFNKDFDISRSKIIEQNDYLFQNCIPFSCTVLFRKIDKVNNALFNCNAIGFGDYTLAISILNHGKAMLSEEIWSFYRIHPGGVYSQVNANKKIEAAFKTYQSIIKNNFANNKRNSCLLGSSILLKELSFISNKQKMLYLKRFPFWIILLSFIKIKYLQVGYNYFFKPDTLQKKKN
jgi:glycosyltransferase involved in cell wall biosynthesis